MNVSNRGAQAPASMKGYQGSFVVNTTTSKDKPPRSFALYAVLAIVVGFSGGTLVGEFLEPENTSHTQVATNDVIVIEPIKEIKTQKRVTKDVVVEKSAKIDAPFIAPKILEKPIPPLEVNVARRAIPVRTVSEKPVSVALIKGLPKAIVTDIIFKTAPIPVETKPVETKKPLRLVALKTLQLQPVVTIAKVKTPLPLVRISSVNLKRTFEPAAPKKMIKRQFALQKVRVEKPVVKKVMAYRQEVKTTSFALVTTMARPSLSPALTNIAFKRIPRPAITKKSATQQDRSTMQPWQQYAVAHTIVPNRPMIAIVIDDLGVAEALSERAIDLPAPLTMSFLPYGGATKRLAAAASKKGHELMVHVPMEPNGHENPGPRALRVGQPQEEVKENLLWALSQFKGYVGVNNHMGSRFTRNRDGLSTVIDHIDQAGLLYLDSLTSGGSVAGSLAKGKEMPFVKRDVFLDDDQSRLAVLESLQRLERVALRKGTAIAIGHPHKVTVDLLRRWLATASDRGFDIVPVTAIYKVRHMKQNGSQQVANAQENKATF